MSPLDSVITAGDRLDIAAASGLELSDEVATVVEAIAALCTIGYGGHYDEALPDEEAALTAIAEAIEVDPDVIHDARADLAERIRAAAQQATADWLAAR